VTSVRGTKDPPLFAILDFAGAWSRDDAVAIFRLRSAFYNETLVPL